MANDRKNKTGPVIGRSPNDAEALQLHKQAKERKDQEGTIGSAKIQRPALAKNIDLSKADPLCTTCGGTGVARYQVIKGTVIRKKGFRPKKEPDQKVPVLCGCVVRNGGVKEDSYDKIRKNLAKQSQAGGGNGKKEKVTIH